MRDTRSRRDFIGEIDQIEVRDGKWFAPDGTELVILTGDLPVPEDPRELTPSGGHYHLRVDGEDYDVSIYLADSVSEAGVQVS